MLKDTSSCSQKEQGTQLSVYLALLTKLASRQLVAREMLPQLVYCVCEDSHYAAS